jgi:hypothetical protein
MKKQLKKSLSLLLTLVMVLGLLPTAALAATAITPTTPAGSGTSADPYRIGTAEELYGFAAIVNGGDTDAHAILTADITVNENVLSYYALNGTEEDFVAWDPINLYEGIFDGRGHTISGLFISYTESNQYDHCGFIEELRGIVRDLTITDSYFRVCYGYYSSSGGVATATANRNIGGICGKLDATGTVWQCHFDGVIDADQGTSTGGFKIGGIVGYNFGGTIKECSLSGRVDGKAGGSDSGVGGIVGVSNIMLITVKERTREFGIRKALGASAWSILRMVIVESMVITTFFGYIGMLCGVIANEYMNATLGNQVVDAGIFQATMFLNPTVGIDVCLQATMVMVLAGTVAGFVPAYKASRMRPIVALNAK